MQALVVFIDDMDRCATDTIISTFEAIGLFLFAEKTAYVVKHIEAAVAAGLWFSVNPAMLRSRNGQRIVAALPRERVVTETDGPHAKLGPTVRAQRRLDRRHRSCPHVGRGARQGAAADPQEHGRGRGCSQKPK